MLLLLKSTSDIRQLGSNAELSRRTCVFVPICRYTVFAGLLQKHMLKEAPLSSSANRQDVSIGNDLKPCFGHYAYGSFG